MKYKEIKNLTAIELRKKLDHLNQEIFNSKMKLSMKRLPNPLVIRTLKKDRARLLTALNLAISSGSKKINKVVDQKNK